MCRRLLDFEAVAVDFMAHTYVFHSVGGALRSVQPLKMRVGHLAGTSSMCAAAAHQGKLGHSRWFSARSFGTSGMSVSVFVRRARNSPVVTQARVYGHRDAVTCAAAAVRPRALGRHTMGHTRRFVSLSRRLHQQGERTSRQQEHRRQRLGFGKIFRVTHFMPPSWSLRALYVLGALHVAALGTWAWWEYGWGEGGPLTFDRPGEHAPKVDVGDVEVSGLSRGEALALQVEVSRWTRERTRGDSFDANAVLVTLPTVSQRAGEGASQQCLPPASARRTCTLARAN